MKIYLNATAIEKLLRARHMSKKSLAEKLGVSYSALQAMLNRVQPKLGSLKKIATALDVSVSEILIREEENECL